MRLSAHLACIAAISLMLSFPRLEACTGCHSRETAMDSGHSFTCTRCHKGKEGTPWPSEAHEGLVAAPGELASSACASCHEAQAKRVRGALMATASGMINFTRYLWGAQPVSKDHYSAIDIGRMKIISDSSNCSSLVDDLLRRRCLRCHLGAYRISPAEGGSGCAACHVIRDESKAGMQPAAAAKVTSSIPSSQCLRCHSGNRVGSDFIGRFERDSSSSYDFDALTPPEPFPSGNRYHKLLPDIHHERGLHCIDCHPQEEVMGDGGIPSHAQEQVGIRCTDCHGLPRRPPETCPISVSNLSPRWIGRMDNIQPAWEVVRTSRGHLLLNTRKENNQIYLISKVNGGKHKIPLLCSGNAPLQHRIDAHMSQLECSACHAAWTFQDMGLHLVLQETAEYEPWSRLTRQEAPLAQELLETNLRKAPTERSTPLSIDWLTGELRAGIWLEGHSLRRWEGRILGINTRGHVSALRPVYQYWVSRIDSEGRVQPDSLIPKTMDGRPALAWMPYTPHTTRRNTPPCWECHGNARSLGCGNTLLRIKDGQRVHLAKPWEDGLEIAFELEQVIDGSGAALQTCLPPGSSFLDSNRLTRLSDRNPRYIRYLLQFFTGKEAYGEMEGFTGPQE
jgi:hypothetical protein